MSINKLISDIYSKKRFAAFINRELCNQLKLSNMKKKKYFKIIPKPSEMVGVKWKFKAEIRKSEIKYYAKSTSGKGMSVNLSLASNQPFHAVLKGKNGEIVFTGENRVSKAGIRAMLNAWFPGIEIIDATKNK